MHVEWKQHIRQALVARRVCTQVVLYKTYNCRLVMFAVSLSACYLSNILQKFVAAATLDAVIVGFMATRTVR